jgi:hypothetical protein
LSDDGVYKVIKYVNTNCQHIEEFGALETGVTAQIFNMLDDFEVLPFKCLNLKPEGMNGADLAARVVTIIQARCPKVEKVTFYSTEFSTKQLDMIQSIPGLKVATFEKSIFNAYEAPQEDPI